MKKIYISMSIIVIVCLTAISAFAQGFIDVPEDAYYAEAAERMADQGILTGYGDGYYYGDQNVTRAQMAVVACRLLGKEDEAKALAGKTAFNDITEAHSWATGYVNYAVANSIFVGDGDGNFRPDDNLKYEEAVKVIVCVLGLDEGVKINPTDWSKEFIEAADKAGLISNLIGKKGEAMKRSDIAVICDSAIGVLEESTEETSVAATSAATINTTTEFTTVNEPEETTEFETKETTAVTTEETPLFTTRTPIVTSYSPPPPYRDNELPEL